LIHPLLPDVEYEKDISIIFGTYNREYLLKNCINTIRAAAKNYNYEIIICDGGSKDGSVEWLEEQDDITLIRGGLTGAVAAFNACFEKATGKYVIALNDDAEVRDDTFRNALKYFQDPTVGQVALTYLERGDWKTEAVHQKLYANYSVTRMNVCKAAARISGGFWSTIYFTYGGDTELSCWVYRLGYKVVAAGDAQLVHHEANDDLRFNNIKKDKQRQAFFHRWPAAECMQFRGPKLSLRSEEIKELARIEMGEEPSDRWDRIAALDPAPGKLPVRVGIRPERVLHVHLWTEEDPQNSLAKAFEKLGSAGHARVDWTKYEGQEREHMILDAARRINPTVVFMQLQGPNISPNVLKQIRTELHDPSLVLVLWSGDVGQVNGPWAGFQDAWSYEMSQYADLMCFTGTGQVQMHRARGMRNAAYLQIGYDVDRYFPGDDKNYGASHDVCFLAQNYGTHFDAIPDNDARIRQWAGEIFSHSGLRFGLYGSGWSSVAAEPVHQTQARDVYHRSHMALSISLTSKLARYSSDRLIRSMASGCPTLVKRFEDMEGWGLRSGENCLAWDEIHEAVETAKVWLNKPEELREIGKAGAELAANNWTWDVRVQELYALINAVRGFRA
jgi:glycosyltransferase involved in cell wall biosynthesis